MIYKETPIDGVFIIDIEPVADERGFFSRTWCVKEFQARGLNSDLVQCNISFNKKRGTLRGMHYQKPPHGEVKVVRCTRGRVFDVILDLRPESPSFQQWLGVELSEDNHHMLYIPEGCAHGFQTLEDDSELFYQMSTFYEPGVASGVRWNDPSFAIRWPLEVAVVSDKDNKFPDYSS